MKKIIFLVSVLLFSSVSFQAVNASYRNGGDNQKVQLPDCLDENRREIVGDNNSEVLRWKSDSKNQYKNRALISGKFVKVLLDRKSHLQIEVDLSNGKGNPSNENIEVIYNKEFGEVRNIAPGAKVVACGDYITAREQAGRYPPSPVGAIVHWVHKSNNPDKHSNGFLAIGDQVFGLEQ